VTTPSDSPSAGAPRGSTDNEELLAARYTASADLVTRKVAGETLIVPIRGQVGDLEAIFTLNEVGSLIWSLLDGRHTGAEMAAAVADEYDVDPAAARADTLEFLRGLAEAGLIRPIESE